MINWQENKEYNSLWIIDDDPKDPWFSHFNLQTQFELSRHLIQFQDVSKPWIFSSSQYLPSTLILIHPLRNTDSLKDLNKQWLSLGSPKALIFNNLNKSIVEQICSFSPEHFKPIQETP